ncbi:hypothetical protein JHS3_16200 [Jeongeupia sp. HS-3]|uniref:M30 family zinc metallopeptidase n=1 Tax=Jeongeupia sp. HS-3 TaxID=1009682 RepID=UPI0018A3A73E|nr:hypothetical protein [Jeongeupia sp. HS-3]BCL75884.1 hypothetical protein JHS3_16200 [Jeongeupia sp. HS-3]
MNDNAFEADCIGANCGTNSVIYSGTGVGAWRYTNSTSNPANVAVALGGVTGKTVTLIYTNQTPNPVAMPTITLSASQQLASLKSVSTETDERINHIPKRVREFNSNRPTLQRAAGALRAIKAPSAAVVGDARSWAVDNGVSDTLETRNALLQKKVTAADGRVVNFWVESGEFGIGKLTAAQLDALASRFVDGSNSVYSMVTGLAGQPWGAHPYTDLIPANQEIDIVFVNFDRNNKPYGLMGYFWSLNNFLKDNNHAELKNSNQSLSFYMDTETVYLGGETGIKNEISTLAHEFVHMINFYQRGVVLNTVNTDNTFDTSWEEMSAMMMEDIIGTRLDAVYHPIRDGRFPEWLAQGAYNCNPLNWINDTKSQCFSYNVTGSFGAYLLRQYGVGFYKHFLRNTSFNAGSQPVALLDSSIKQFGGRGYAEALRRWGASIALLPSATSPAGFGYPQRVDSGFTLPGLNGSNYASVRKLPTSVPGLLEGYAHFPIVRKPAGASYVEMLTVPAGTTLSVIVN